MLFLYFLITIDIMPMEILLSSSATSNRYNFLKALHLWFYHSFKTGKILRYKLITAFFIVILSLLSGSISVSQANQKEPVFVRQTNREALSIESVHLEVPEEDSVVQVRVSGVTQKKSVITKIPEPIEVKETQENQKSQDNISTDEKSSDTKDNNVSENVFLKALNDYRVKNGKSPLSWDAKLADYAKSRADAYSAQGGLDHHAGFQDFINNQDGFKKLGFNSLGENSGYGHAPDPVFIIEEAYGKSSSHNENQLGSQWSHVGVGISGTATNFIFGGSKL